MKQAKLATSICISLSILSFNTFAHPFSKNEAVTANTNALHHFTGLYAGLNAGIEKHTTNVTDIQATAFYATIQEVSNQNITGGLQIGYRHQLDLSNVSGVYGLEGSIDFANTSFKQNYGSSYALYELSAKNTLKNIYMLQLIGGLASENTLLFFAAGLSWANITASMTSLNDTPYFSGFNTSNTPTGTAIGGGIEYAFSKKLSARLKVDAITTKTYSTFDNVNGFEFQLSNSIVIGSLGLNYTF